MIEMKSPPRAFAWMAALFGLSSLTGCGGGQKQVPPPSNPPTLVDVIVVQPTQVNRQIEVNGEIVAGEYVELHPEVSGRLTYLNVPEGSNVAAGTVLARINDADLQAQLGKIQVQLKLAKQTEERLKKLLDVNGVNQADYDGALGQVQSLQADEEYTKAMLQKTVLMAPFSGTLGLRQVSPGAYVTPATTISTLQQVNVLKVDFSLPDTYGQSVKVGDTVAVTLGGLNTTRTFSAKISAIEPQLDRNTRNLLVRAILNTNDAHPGEFVKVGLGAAGSKTSFLIPTNSIIPEAMNKKVVTVKGGKAVFAAVKTGSRQDKNIEVTEGLQAGDTVVVDGVLFAKPGAPLKVRQVKTLQP